MKYFKMPLTNTSNDYFVIFECKDFRHNCKVIYGSRNNGFDWRGVCTKPKRYLSVDHNQYEILSEEDLFLEMI